MHASTIVVPALAHLGNDLFFTRVCVASWKDFVSASSVFSCVYSRTADMVLVMCVLGSCLLLHCSILGVWYFLFCH